MVSAKYSALSLAGKTAKNNGFQELLATLRNMIRTVSAPIFGLAVKLGTSRKGSTHALQSSGVSAKSEF